MVVSIVKPDVARSDLIFVKDTLLNAAEMLADLAVDHGEIVNNIVGPANYNSVLHNINAMLENINNYILRTDEAEDKLEELKRFYEHWKES